MLRSTLIIADRLTLRKLLPSLVPALLIAATLAVALVLLFYVFGFAHGFAAPLAAHAKQWADFGEYIGGTLGACFGFFAFIGILITIRIQLSQLELDELQRLLASEAARLSDLLDLEPKKPGVLLREYQKDGLVETIYSLLESAAAATISQDPKITEAKRDELRLFPINQIKFETRILNVEIPQFVALLKQYKRAGGSAVVISHYESKYALPVGFMDVTGLLYSDVVRGYFRDSRIAMQICVQWGIPRERAYFGRFTDAV